MPDVSAAGTASLHRLAACLKQHSSTLTPYLPGLLAATVLKLHAAANPLLLGCFTPSDGQADEVLVLLAGLHEALQQCQLDDGVLRGCVALRFALLLEQQGDLEQASTIIHQVSCGKRLHAQSRRNLGADATLPLLLVTGSLAGVTLVR